MKTTLLKTAGLVFGIMMMTNISVGQTQNRPKQPNRPSFEQVLKNLDEDSDGKLSKSEAKGPLQKNFAKVDTDEDGFITKVEFENAPKIKQRKGKMSKKNKSTFSDNSDIREVSKNRPSYDQMLRSLDTDSDGKLSKSEVKGPLSNHFTKVDTDEDGFITKVEFDNTPRPNRPDFEQVLNDLDADKDGKLSKMEAQGPLQNNFEKVDTDEDGFITKTEFDNTPRPKQQNAKMGRRNPRASFARANNRQGRPTFEQVLKNLDTDADGKISKSEAKGPLQKNFAKVDTDEDGFITKVEFDNVPRLNRPDFEQVLNELDTDKDGKLSKTEAKGMLQNNFEKVDVDKDGFITKTEFENAPRPKQRKARR